MVDIGTIWSWLIYHHYKNYIPLINLTRLIPLSLSRRGGDIKISNTFPRIILLKNERKPPIQFPIPYPQGRGYTRLRCGIEEQKAAKIRSLRGT